MDWSAWVKNARDIRTNIREILKDLEFEHKNNRTRGKFVYKLYLMLLHPQGKGLFEWNENGTALCMPIWRDMNAHDRQRMTRFLLLFFNHGNVSTVQRQFCFFNFVRDKKTAPGSTMYAYRHPHFVRAGFRLTEIKRKTYRGKEVRKRKREPSSEKEEPVAPPRSPSPIQIVEPLVIQPLLPPPPEKIPDAVMPFGQMEPNLDISDIQELLKADLGTEEGDVMDPHNALNALDW